MNITKFTLLGATLLLTACGGDSGNRNGSSSGGNSSHYSESGHPGIFAFNYYSTAGNHECSFSLRDKNTLILKSHRYKKKGVALSCNDKNYFFSASLPIQYHLHMTQDTSRIMAPLEGGISSVDDAFKKAIKWERTDSEINSLQVYLSQNDTLDNNDAFLFQAFYGFEQVRQKYLLITAEQALEDKQRQDEEDYVSHMSKAIKKYEAEHKHEFPYFAQIAFSKNINDAAPSLDKLTTLYKIGYMTDKLGHIVNWEYPESVKDSWNKSVKMQDYKTHIVGKSPVRDHNESEKYFTSFFDKNNFSIKTTFNKQVFAVKQDNNQQDIAYIKDATEEHTVSVANVVGSLPFNGYLIIRYESITFNKYDYVAIPITIK